jgi:hypothetical protein
MTESELQALIDTAEARYQALSPSARLRHDYMQRRSFVRGMCPSNRDFAEHCRSVDKILPDEKFLTDIEIGLILAGSTVSRPHGGAT